MNKKVLAITVVAFIVATSGAGGGVWYYLGQQAKKQNEEKQKQLDELKKQVEGLKGTITDGKDNAEDETIDWKTYTNKDYGFSIKYPKDWSNASCDSGNVQFTYSGQTAADCELPDLGEASVIISISDLSKDPEIPSLASQINTTSASYVDAKKEILTFVGYDATKIFGSWKLIEASAPPEGTKQTDLVFQKGKQIYFLTNRQLKKQEDTTSIYNQMLSSFKFTK